MGAQCAHAGLAVGEEVGHLGSHRHRMAGVGELVYYEGGREAAMTLNPAFVPVDHAIVGIVDGVNVPHPHWKGGPA